MRVLLDETLPEDLNEPLRRLRHLVDPVGSFQSCLLSLRRANIVRVSSTSEVADHAVKRFARLARAFPDDDAFPADLPPDPHFRYLIEEVFWASISRDEGRPCRFTVAYYGRGPSAPNDDLAVSLVPKTYTRDVLRRLAAVAHAADAEIAVSLVDNELRIVGLCKQLRPYTDPQTSTAPRPIEIEVRGPAHIVIRYLIFRISTYAHGEILEPSPNVLDLKGPFRSALDALAETYAIRSIDLRFDLKSLLAQVDRHAHGGLIVLSARKPEGLESVSWPITNDVYGLPEARQLHSDSLRRMKLPKDHPDRLSFAGVIDVQRASHRLSADILQLLAALTLTDGGVWLDGSLRPRAFGVFAELTPDIRINSAKDVLATRLEEMKFDTLGARHRALVAVADKNPGCPAIAMSVDGGFAAALKDVSRHDVLVWRFQSWDWNLDDPFDPQSEAVWDDLLEAARTRSRKDE